MTCNVAVVGQGFVGGSLTTVLSERGCNVLSFDINGRVAKGGKDTGAFSLTEFTRICVELDVDIFFVCLPTPMTETGHTDLSVVDGAVHDIVNVSPGKKRERIVVIKSTVPPGTCSYWESKFMSHGTRIVFNPEFLTEANALDDMRNQNRIVLGGHPTSCARVEAVLSKFFSGVPFIKTTSNNAEMVKYLANCFLATKVSFANEMRQIAEGLTASGKACDFDSVVEIATLDPRLGSSHWQTPGPDGKNGFGGSCFPKDMNSMIRTAQSVHVDPVVLCAAWEKNLQLRPERDWELLKGRAVSV